MAAAVDVNRVAGHLGLEAPSIQEAITTPTPELVSSILAAVLVKAQEFETIATAKLRLEIELENAVRSSESRWQASKTTADKALQDTDQLRQKLQEEESRRLSLESEIQSMKTKSGDRESETTSLKARIESLQDSNRATISVLEERNSRMEQLSEELTKQHQKNVELSKEVSSLSQSVRSAEASVNTAKYREESLKQQMALAVRNAEWFETELKAKSEEAMKYRKEKGARITELQRQNDEAKSELDFLRRSEQQLRERVDAAQSKADDAFVKLQQQQEAFARTEQSYKQEIKDQKRLVDMSQEFSKKHQERVHEVEAEKERLRDNFENEVRRVRLDLEKETQNCTNLEQQMQQLETELDQVRARLVDGSPAVAAPQTPRPLNGSMLGRASPFGTPGSTRKNAITTSQAIDELYKVKGQLATERRRNQQLAEELESIMVALEAKAPEINDLNTEVETLRADIVKMSELSQQSFEERDAATKAARKAERELGNSVAEINILRTQLRDLSMQIRMLVFKINILESGSEQLSPEEEQRLEKLSRGEMNEDDLADMSDTHQFITERYAVFKNVEELQQKNQELLDLTRQLAEKMESEEAMAEKHQAAEDRQAVEQLTQDLRNMTEESKSVKTTMESYKAERDMFRRLLQNKATAGELASVLGSNYDESQRPPLASIESAAEYDAASATAALREQQAIFDNFRSEQATVRKSMQDKIDELASEKSKLQTEVASLSAQVSLASERYNMLQSNFTASQNELRQIQESNRSMSSNAAKSDMRMQQMSEELIHAQGIADGMQRENSNLKAEKELWKDIQTRLSKDNEALVEEKGRLNALLATQQSVLNEKDIAEAEFRRKSQDNVEQLESELVSTKEKLSKESEEVKQLQLRKEYEAKESQKRIDDLMANIRQIREEHVGVKTSKGHLEARVNELMAELRNAEERFGRLLPHATPRSGTAQQNEDSDAVVQELTNEISDLKRELELARTHLENTKEQAEHYKEISRAAEEALEELTESQEQFRLGLETSLTEKDASVKELTERVADLSTELSTSNNELSKLRDSQGEMIRKFEEEKSILSEDINRLKIEAEKSADASRFHQQDLRAQAEIATRAQQDYEQELMKHAEAAKQLQTVRVEYNELRGQLATYRAEAESSKLALSQTEVSYKEREAQLSREVSELKARHDDANAQNKILHQQLESVGAQVAALQESRSAGASGSEGNSTNGTTGGATSTDSASDGLRELNNYLRREKEILEVQYDIKTSEAKRLQEQLTACRADLDEVRLRLEQERRAAAESGKTSMSHKELMEKLEELNLYRESSATLRSELEESRRVVGEKSAKIDELSGRIQPLIAEIEELKTQKSFLESELKMIQEDRDHWQKRTEGILTKYGRVDPAEMEQLKETIAALESERDALQQNGEPLQAKVEELTSILEGERIAHETDKNKWTATRQNLEVQFKDRYKRVSNDKNEALQRVKELEESLGLASQNLSSANENLASTTNVLSTTTEELGLTKQQVAQYEQQLLEFRSQMEQLQLQTDSSAVVSLPTTLADAEAQDAVQVTSQLEEQLSAVRQQVDAVTAQKTHAEAELESLRSQLQAAQAERDEAVRNSQSLAAASSAPTTDAMVVEDAAPSAAAATAAAAVEPQTDAVAVVPQEAPAQDNAEPTESTSADINENTNNASHDNAALIAKLAASEAKILELEKKVAELEAQLAAAESRATDAESRVTEAKTQVSESETRAGEAETRLREATVKIEDFENNNTRILKERSDKMRQTLNDKLRESRAKLEEEFQLKLQQEKIIWQSQQSQAPAAANGEAPPMATPKKEPTNDIKSTPAPAGTNTEASVEGTSAAVAATSAASAAAGSAQSIIDAVNNLSDNDVRQLLSTNNTIKTILTSNVKKRLEVELAKNKTETEQKITAARENAEQLAKKKGTLQLNLMENKMKLAHAKIAVVETAASETPTKAVAEVWEVAKDAKWTPDTQAPTFARPASVMSMAQGTPLPASPSAPTPGPRPASAAPVASTPVQQKLAGPSGLPVNPFANATPAGVVNPFASNNANATPGQQPQQQQPPQSQIPQGMQQQQQPGVRSGIPMLRGVGRGRGGPNVGNRVVSTGQDGQGGPPPSGLPQRGGFNARGRGGGGGNRGGLNPAATEFKDANAGNKRPRGDSEMGNAGGAKRARGGGGAH